jgi:hypothetical protein
MQEIFIGCSFRAVGQTLARISMGAGASNAPGWPVNEREGFWVWKN